MLVTIAIVSLALLQALVIARVLLRPHRDPVQRIAWILLIAGAPVLGMRRRPGETLHRQGAKNAKKTYSKTQPENAGISPSRWRTSCPRFFFASRSANCKDRSNSIPDALTWSSRSQELSLSARGHSKIGPFPRGEWCSDQPCKGDS